MDGDLDKYVGAGAGLLTSVLWTATSLSFTAAARRIGSTAVNGARLTLAVLLLAVTHRLLTGHWIPSLVNRQVVFLALSGLIGLTLGDQALFTAFVHIGPRLAMLIMSTSPIFAAMFGWVVLGETLHAISWVGVGLTLGGVCWVLLERPDAPTKVAHPHRLQGVLLALVGALCQAGGMLLSKQGMGHGWLPAGEMASPQTATLTRMFFAWLGILPVLLLRSRQLRRRRAAGAPMPERGSVKAGYVFTACGAVVGPFLGVWMSLVAVDRAPLGVAQTLCSLAPVFLLPFAIWLHKERVSPRAAIGAIVALCGSALLFFRPA